MVFYRPDWILWRTAANRWPSKVFHPIVLQGRIKKGLEQRTDNQKPGAKWTVVSGQPKEAHPS